MEFTTSVGNGVPSGPCGVPRGRRPRRRGALRRRAHGGWPSQTVPFRLDDLGTPSSSKYAGSGWSESGSGTASALMSATFIYKDKTTSKNSTSSGGPNGSSHSTSRFNESHGLVDFTLNGSTEHYELLDGEWFMSSSDGAEVETEKRTYGTSSSGSGSSVGYSGDYSGGNGTRNASWYSGSYDDHEVDNTKQTTSSHTTAVPGGPKTTTSTASGGQSASGTQDQTGTNGSKKETRATQMSMSGEGHTMSSMSAFSSTRAVHNEYKDSTHYDRTTVTIQPASGSGATASGGGDGSVSGGGMASGGTGSGAGTASGGSGSFHVSGNDTVTTVQQWSSGSGSVHSVTGTQSSSYSSAVHYWGFGRDENVRFPAASVFFGPGSASWGVFGEPGELEPGPAHGPLSGTNAGPSPDLTATSPMRNESDPEAHVTPTQFNAALGAAITVAQGLAKAPSVPSPPAVLGMLSDAVSKYATQGMPQAKAPPLSDVEKEPSPQDQANPAPNAGDLLALAEANDEDAEKKDEKKQAPEKVDGKQLSRDELLRARQYALLARAAYDVGAPDGWTVEHTFTDYTTDDNTPLGGKAPPGFRAILYKNKDGEYVLAFAGTDFTQSADVVADLKQALGMVDAQYEHAIKLAEAVATKYKGVSFTGHSLGGGLATAASIVWQVPAVVFNPAGVHKATVKRHNADVDKPEAPIFVYRTEGEILTGMQDSKFLPLGWVLPDTVATRIVNLDSGLPKIKALKKHGMDAVIRAIDMLLENKP